MKTLLLDPRLLFLKYGQFNEKNNISGQWGKIQRRPFGRKLIFHLELSSILLTECLKKFRCD